MKMNADCDTCAWAQYSDKPGIIVRGNKTIIHSGGTMRCTAGTIQNLTITDQGMYCSSYRPKEKGHGIQES